MSDDSFLVHQRKEAFIRFLKQDPQGMILSAFALVSFVLMIAGYAGVIRAGGQPFLWLTLALIIAAGCFYLKKQFLASIPLIAWVVWLSTYIRTRNLGGLRDITTGGWTLGPDLDPFLFLRWAKYIVEHGTLMATDSLRYLPLGYATHGELFSLSYMMAGFHGIAGWFGSGSVEQSAALFPVFMFALTLIAFFLFVREAFKEFISPRETIAVAFIAALFLAISPSLLPRTIGGIPEKESAAFFFMFLALYLFIKSWKSETLGRATLFSIGAGIMTAGMALVWGGYIYLLVTIGPAVALTFLLGRSDKKALVSYGTWIIVTFLIASQFSSRYAISGLLKSTIILLLLGVLAFLVLGSLWKERARSLSLKIPLIRGSPELVIVGGIVLAGLIVVLVLFGGDFLLASFKEIISLLIKPTTNRLGVTVAENRQPYFGEWAASFGPSIGGIPVFLFLFLIGSVYLVYNLFAFHVRRPRYIFAGSFAFMILAIVFSRYTETGLFNGENTASIGFYFIGLLVCAGAFFHAYLKSRDAALFERISKNYFGIVIILMLFLFTLVSVRGAVRLILILTPAASILAAYLVTITTSRTLHSWSKKDSSLWLNGIIAAALVLLTFVAAYQFYLVSVGTAQSYIPSVYTQQWQLAMGWVRESTPQNAVFAHWWDYGYWVQSIGERATVLDGGNAIPYWNHLMGRYALTGISSFEAAEFLYAHNTTHFLIDSSDIGKYTAFSSIGSDVNYDRNSWMSTFVRDDRQVQETKNATIYVYTGGTPLDADIVYRENDTSAPLFLAREKAVLAAVVLEKNGEGVIQGPAKGIFVMNNNQYSLPLRYLYSDTFKDFATGVEAGIYLMPRLVISSNNQAQIAPDGALIYLSNRTVKSQLARLYLYKENDPIFKLVHSEDDSVITNIKSSNIALDKDIIFFNGVRGPIRIWEIEYPKNIEFKPEFINTTYPDIRLYQS